MLSCVAADAGSSTRLSEGGDAESSETVSLEGQGKAATSINWMHVRCPLPLLCLNCACTWPVADTPGWSQSSRRVSLCKECGIGETWH